MVNGARSSPLGHYAERFAEADTPGVIGFREVPFTTQLTLRLSQCSSAWPQTAQALGGRLPREPNTACHFDNRDVIWMGPDEWLIVAPNAEGGSLESPLRTAFVGAHASVVDVSAQRTIIEVTGNSARNVLARGCAIDLHPLAFHSGRCAQTLMARAHVLLLARAGTGNIWVFIRASFAEYMAEWLLDASLEERTGAGQAGARTRTLAMTS
jgi:sarcosine oxidase subunit gamma